MDFSGWVLLALGWIIVHPSKNEIFTDDLGILVVVDDRFVMFSLILPCFSLDLSTFFLLVLADIHLGVKVMDDLASCTLVNYCYSEGGREDEQNKV